MAAALTRRGRRPVAVPAAVLLVVAGVLWGTGGAAGATLQARTDLTSHAVAFWRLAAAAALLVAGHALLGRTAQLRVARRDLPLVAAVGVLLAVFQSSYFAAVSRLGVAVATLVTLGLAPVLVAAAVAVRRRALPPRRTALALVVALTGLALVVLGSGAGEAATGLGATGSPLGGFALAVLSSTGFAAVTLVSPRLGRRVAPTTTVSVGFVVGALVLLPVALVAGPVLPGTDPADLLVVAYLGAGPTALAYALYLGALRRAEPSAGGLAALLEPVTAAVVATLVLDERMGPLAVLGGVAVVVAIGLGSTRPRRARAPDDVTQAP